MCIRDRIDSISKTNFFITTDRSVSDKPISSLYDCQSLSKLYQTDNQLIIFDNVILEYKYKIDYKTGNIIENKIAKIDLVSHEIDWEVNLNKLGYSGARPRGVRSNVLFFMKDQYSKISDTIALDIDNGELLWKLDIPNKRYYKADTRYDKLISLHDGYIERDLYTGQIILEHKDEDVYREFNGIRRRGSNFCQVGKYLIAIVHRKGKIFVYLSLIHISEPTRPY